VRDRRSDRGRRWASDAARAQLRRVASKAGARRRFAPHQLRHANAVELAHEDVNRFLRGWAGYFRYGNSARQFDKIGHYALDRIARFVAKRHKRSRGYGWKAVAYQSPNRLGLINLNGTIVAPRPNRPWRPGR
jgi:RNA-directed DNA polymerase